MKFGQAVACPNWELREGRRFAILRLSEYERATYALSAVGPLPGRGRALLSDADLAVAPLRAGADASPSPLATREPR